VLELVDKDLAMRVDEWLADFEHALSHTHPEALAALFHDDCYWRDVLAFTWLITTGRADAGVRFRN